MSTSIICHNHVNHVSHQDGGLNWLLLEILHWSMKIRREEEREYVLFVPIAKQKHKIMHYKTTIELAQIELT